MLTVLGLAAAATIQQAVIRDPNSPSISVAPELARRYPSGIELFRVVVSPEGNVATCKAIIEGRGPVPDAYNCKKVLRFVAEPAVDQNGEKTFGTATVVVTWQVYRGHDTPHPSSAPLQVDPDLLLPVNHLPAGARSDVTSELLVVAAADGKVETCVVGQTSGLPALDQAACRAVATAGVTPAKDAAGMAVRAVQSIKVGFSVHP